MVSDQALGIFSLHPTAKVLLDCVTSKSVVRFLSMYVSGFTEDQGGCDAIPGRCSFALLMRTFHVLGSPPVSHLNHKAKRGHLYLGEMGTFLFWIDTISCGETGCRGSHNPDKP